MARCSDLPPELIALIIGFHCGAKSHLHQYSLVCRAWLSPSQRRLFHTFRYFNLVEKVVPFCEFLLGAPKFGSYVREITIVGPFDVFRPEVNDFVANATDRENIENLFSLLPNITQIIARFLASSPFLFTNSLLRQCRKLRKFSIAFSIRLKDVVSPAAILPVFQDTTVKSLDIRKLFLPSAIESPPDSHAKVCSVERLTLQSTHNLSVWFPYFRGILPTWSELKIVCDVESIPEWSDILRANDLSHLRRLHVSVTICLISGIMVSEFPHDDASPLVLSAPSLNHLLLTMKVTHLFEGLEPQDIFSFEYDITTEVIVSMVEWYTCTLTALSQGRESALKELTLTVMNLDESTVAAVWAKVDGILSTSAFGRLKHVHFFDEKKNPITICSDPGTIAMLNQVLPKLSRAGKLAV